MNQKEFYWISSPETRHSRNITKREQISIVAGYSVQDTRLEEVRPPGLYRLYRAVALEHLVLDPHASPDRRTPVTL